MDDLWSVATILPQNLSSPLFSFGLHRCGCNSSINTDRSHDYFSVITRENINESYNRNGDPTLASTCILNYLVSNRNIFSMWWVADAVFPVRFFRDNPPNDLFDESFCILFTNPKDTSYVWLWFYRQKHPTPTYIRESTAQFIIITTPSDS